MLATLLFVICMSANPSSCQTVDPLLDRVPLIECSVHWQQALSDWMAHDGANFKPEYEHAASYQGRCVVGERGRAL
jgi:hypothetical protein